MTIWKARSIGRNTKIKLFPTLVRPVLLYGYKAWKITKTEEKRLDRFQFTCLRRILRIWWPHCVGNETITEITGVNRISVEIRGRRLNGIRHVRIFSELSCTELNLQARLATQRKSVRKSIMCLLASTRVTVWPGLNR